MLSYTHCPFCGNDLSLVPCPTCEGSGWVSGLEQNSISVSLTTKPCSRCKGDGYVKGEDLLKEALEEDSERYRGAWKELAKEE